MFVLLGLLFGWWASALLFVLSALGVTDKLVKYITKITNTAPEQLTATPDKQAHQRVNWRESETHLGFLGFWYRKKTRELNWSAEKLE